MVIKVKKKKNVPAIAGYISSSNRIPWSSYIQIYIQLYPDRHPELKQLFFTVYSSKSSTERGHHDGLGGQHDGLGGPPKPQLDRYTEDGKQQRESKEMEKSQDPKESSDKESREKETGEIRSIGMDRKGGHGLLGELLDDYDDRDGGGVRQHVLVSGS